LNKEGREFAKRSKNSSSVAEFMNPVNGVRDQMRRLGITPKNHAKENKQLIKRLEEKNRQQKLKADYREPLDLSTKFKNIRSKVFTSTTEKAPTHTNYLKKRDIDITSGNINEQAPERTPKTKRKAEVPRQTCNSTPPLRKESRNHVKENMKNIRKLTKPKQKPAEEENFLHKKSYGKLPAYLVKRRIEMAEQKARKQFLEEQASLPEGMRLMDEEERLDTLVLLEKNKIEVERKLLQLPLIVETPGMKRKERDLREKILNIEHAIKTFSKPMVYIQTE